MAVETPEHAPQAGPAGSAWRRFAGVRRGVLELLFTATLYVIYDSSRLLASGNIEHAKARAQQLLRIERAIGIDWEHTLNNWFTQHDTFGLLACYWYSTAHYILTLVVLVWLYFKGRHAYLPARRALLVGTMLALALYLMLPTAPPRFMGYTDVLALHTDQGWWGSDASAPRGLGDLTNQLAAFPSLHCGWALWVAIQVHRNCRNWVVRLLAWTAAAMTAIAVIGTGNHWILDVIVGWMVIVVGVVAVSAFTREPEPAREVDTA